MKIASIAELKNNLSKFISLVEDGEEITICKQNIPIAHVVPISGNGRKNKTKLGCGKGSAEILGDLTDPLIPMKNWEMVNNNEDSA